METQIANFAESIGFDMSMAQMRFAFGAMSFMALSFLVEIAAVFGIFMTRRMLTANRRKLVPAYLFSGLTDALTKRSDQHEKAQSSD